MKKIALLFLFPFFVMSCKSDKFLISNPKFTKVVVDTLYSEKISCRALLIDSNRVWYAGNGGKYGYISLDNSANYNGVVNKDNLKLEFRSIAHNSSSVFILSVANPGLLYKIDKKTKSIDLVYEEKGDKVFYDSMTFLNENEGIAVGDPTSVCPSIIVTNNGGLSWEKLDCLNLPKFEEGEAFFAASNTNIIYRNKTLFMISGGKSSRVFTSIDKGRTWQINKTPIIQGQAMTGAFCADFYDDEIGIIAGGNYEKLDQNFKNKALTTDGGKSWELVSDNQAFGYASCIQFLPNSGGRSILEVGATGIFYSRDKGSSWTQLAPDKDLIAFRFIDDKTAIASGKNRIVKLTLQ